MNRINISPLVSRPLQHSELKKQPKNSGGTATACDTDFSIEHSFARTISDSSLFVPLHYEKNYQYPLIVWLHSNGDDAQQLFRVMPHISLQNFVGVAPQAALGEHHVGYYWEQDDASIDYAADAVRAAIDHACLRTNVNPKRIFVAGYGEAGTMAFRVALTHPDIFAGVISMNGPLPENATPLGNWSSSRHVEVFWAHCRNSVEFKQNQLCRQLRLLHVAGFSVTLRQYPGDDQLSNPALADLNRWIMQAIDSSIV